MTALRIALVIVAGASACGGKSEEAKPSDPGSGSGSATLPAIAAAIGTGPQLPVVTFDAESALGYTAVTVVDGKLRTIGAIGAETVVDDAGRLTKPLPARDVTDRNPGRSAVIADAGESAKLLDAVFAAGEPCTNLVVAKAGHVLVLPVCKPRARAGGPEDQPVLYLTPEPKDTQVVVTKVNDGTIETDATSLDTKLAAERAGVFKARTDARILVRSSLTIGRLAEAIAALRRAGFTDIALEPEAEQPAPPPPVTATSSAPSTTTPTTATTRVAPPSATVTVSCVRADGGSLDDCQKAVAKTVPFLTDCFIKAKGHDGNADLSFAVVKGRAKDVKVGGDLPHPFVGNCSAASMRTVDFDPKMMAARVTVTFKHGS